MREAMLYRQAGVEGHLQCDICLWRCRIGPSRLGRCKVRVNRDGKLYDLVYGRTSAVHVDPIEKKPLFHFYPGSRVLSLGTWGCNFRCLHCQNWTIAYAEASGDDNLLTAPGGMAPRSDVILPRQAIESALQQGCQGICWTYNEPTIWLEYTLDSAKLAKERGLYTAYVTNGFLTPEALDLLGPYLDAFRVDIKGFSDQFYRKIAKVARWRDILSVTRRARERWGMHVEVVTNLIPTLNDDGQLQDIATWIVADLGASTPWHVTAFHPDALLSDVPPTPRSTLLAARAVGLSAGLHFVYTGNMPGIGGEDTRCYQCGSLAVERAGYQARVIGAQPGGRCSHCAADLNLRGV